MMKLRTKLAGATVMATVGLALAAPSAYAHPENQLPDICGDPSYFIVNDSGGVGDQAKRPLRTPAGTRWGYVYLLYSNETGKNCVVTLKTTFHGTPSIIGAALWVQGEDAPKVDQDPYSHYADVQADAENKCVAYAGKIANPSGTTVATGGRPEWGNCG